MLVDAALAITLTLLMLDIRLPGDAGAMNDTQLAGALLAIWPRYLAYVLSFLVIGTFWISHRQKLRRIVRGDGIFTWLNIVFLMALGLIPFVTSLIAENPGSTGTMAYAAVLSAVSLMLTLIWGYAIGCNLTEPGLLPSFGRRALVISIVSTAILMASVGIALFQADAAKYMWLILIPLAISRLRGRQAKADAT
jgi:TMEM175 potassium channel family protein